MGMCSSEAKVVTYQGMTVGTRSEHQDVGEVPGNTGKTYYSKFAYDGRAFRIRDLTFDLTARGLRS